MFRVNTFFILNFMRWQSWHAAPVFFVLATQFEKCKFACVHLVYEENLPGKQSMKNNSPVSMAGHWYHRSNTGPQPGGFCRFWRTLYLRKKVHFWSKKAHCFTRKVHFLAKWSTLISKKNLPRWKFGYGPASWIRSWAELSTGWLDSGSQWRSKWLRWGCIEFLAN